MLKEGRFGPYVTDGETNASLRKGDDPEAVTLERALELLAERRAKGPAKRAGPPPQGVVNGFGHKLRRPVRVLCSRTRSMRGIHLPRGSFERRGACRRGGPSERVVTQDFPPKVRRLARQAKKHEERTEGALTQNQLNDLLESDQIRAIVEGAEERGFIDPAEIEAFAAELELNDHEGRGAHARARAHRARDRPAGRDGACALRRRGAEGRRRSRRAGARARDADRRDLRLRRQPPALPRRRRPPQAADRGRGGHAREARSSAATRPRSAT